MSAFSKFLKNCIFVTYPSGGKGQAFSRILYTHEELCYWSSLMNPWYQTDITCKKPLDWIEAQEHTHILPQFNENKIYTATHLDYRRIFEMRGAKECTYKTFESYFYNKSDKHFITNIVKSNKKIILPTHAGVEEVLKSFPNNTIINLYSNKENSIINHRGWPPTPYHLTKKYYWEPFTHSNVLNISKEKFFSENFNQFENEYKKIILYFKLKKRYTNKIRTFILRHTERCEYYKEIELKVTKPVRVDI